ncbi:MAG: sulfate ABC transporter substrate-binding protein [Planctomycetia bacterium]|nr:sulfate ABC transporter substrate-binding protein [Planctomycetia bacterium]
MVRIASFGFVTLAALTALLLGDGAYRAADPKPTELLNVSYDPTRELYRDLNAAFAARHHKDQGVKASVKQSHGGSTSQAKAVIDGSQEADVVTLALWSDIDALRQKGLIAQGWEKRLPENSLPYYSTIVFVVRKGNPKGVKDWADLVKPGVQLVTPSPKTSGNGKLTFLAAWGSVIHRGQSEKEARSFVENLYKNVVALDPAARTSTISFVDKKIGDVHLTWENEAQQAVRASNGELEIVYPPVSIRAEPYVAWVDANVKKHHSQALAEAYLKFLYTPEAQEIIARHHYRPIQAEVLKKHQAQLPTIDLFPVTAVAKDWAEAEQKFFASGGLAEQLLVKPASR